MLLYIVIFQSKFKSYDSWNTVTIIQMSSLSEIKIEKIYIEKIIKNFFLVCPKLSKLLNLREYKLFSTSTKKVLAKLISSLK